MPELDRDAIINFLAKQYVGHVGFIGEGGRPEVFPVHYIAEDQTVYFATEEGNRLVDLPKQESVCFEVDEAFPELGAYRSVIAHGRAWLIEDPDEHQRILRRLMERFERLGPLWATSKYYPAHAMSAPAEHRPLLVVAIPLSDLSGRELGVA